MRGFTLIEVVMALLILEVALLGVVGMFAAATTLMWRAETLERVVAEAEGVLDSLAFEPDVADGTSRFHGGDLAWAVEGRGLVRVVGRGPTADTVLNVVAGVVVR